MTRSELCKEIMSQVGDDDIVIASTGFISREIFKYDRDLNFYMMGSMGNALAIGIGLAMNLPQRVFVINGDGSVLMSLGTLITAKKLGLKNLIHFILDNNCHESTGGQPTVSQYVDFEKLCKNTFHCPIIKDNTVPPRITLEPKQITERFRNAIIRLKKQ